MADEPSHAEGARTLVETGLIGTLATQLADHGGGPFGSLTPYAVDGDGQPILLISRLAVHSRNLAADARASLLVAEAGDDEALARGRVTLVGRVAPVADGERAACRDDYLARHPAAAAWADFGDFGFHRLAVAAAYFVAGFGAMSWVDGADYRAAAPDPLAPHAAGILAHMNADHADALRLYCQAFAGVTTARATMTAIDRLGLRVRAETPDGARSLRIAFPRPAQTPGEARTVLVEMVRDARARAS
jgi:putative heme iron utilization protein